MGYGAMLAYHVKKQAQMTISCIEVSLEEAKGLGVIGVDQENRIVSFDEKLTEPQPIPGTDQSALASMGNYIFNTDFLYEKLQLDACNNQSSHDFAKDIIPSIIHEAQVVAYPFQGEEKDKPAYWRDVGTLDAFWEANMDLVGITPELNLYDEDWPILTYQSQLPSAKFVLREHDRQGMALDSIVSGGCIISGAAIERSLLFSKVRVHSFAKVNEAVVLPEVDIGRNCRIKRAIIDRGCQLPNGTVIGEDPEEDARRFRVTSNGIVLVTPDTLGQKPNTTI
jgi:glucose-1-phosphate adenylyltransferase